MTFLVERGYRGRTFQDAVARSSPGKTAVITFDDAYRSVIELALPILARAAFPATVFAPTAFIGTEQPMAWPGTDHWLESEYRRELVPMSWAELEKLAKEGWEIGSHTRTHPRLTTLEEGPLDSELLESRHEIEDRIGRACRSVAYPYGEHDPRVVEAARRAGYGAGACTARGGLRPATSSLDWPRTVVNRGDYGHRMRLKLSPRLRRLRGTRAWGVVGEARRGIRGARSGPHRGTAGTDVR